MTIEEINKYRKKVCELMNERGFTQFSITGIRHHDQQEKADDFIRLAPEQELTATLLPDTANPFDHEAVSCYVGNNQVGYVAAYELEKYQVLAAQRESDHLTGQFVSGSVDHHMLWLKVQETLTLEGIAHYRKEVDRQKNTLYGNWQHDAIDQYLVHCRQQNLAKVCIAQMHDAVLQLFDPQGNMPQDGLKNVEENYKLYSHYDISLEGQRNRWDILLYLDYLNDVGESDGRLADIQTQIGRELVRSGSYKDYVERLSDLVTRLLPSSENARRYLRTLPAEAFERIREQTQAFPHYRYNLFRTDPQEFVRTLFYARIPLRYLDPFLSGIALVEAFDRCQASERPTSQKTTVSPSSNKKPNKKKSTNKPKTLKYYIHGNNGVLMSQHKRVDIIFRMFSEWGWIDGQTGADDFDAFFEGTPRHCNITWTGSSTILTILLQELLKQPYIQEQTGCRAKSLVEQQFGKTANSDRKRLDRDAEEKIKLTLLILDINNPLPERQGRNSYDETDITFAAINELYSGQLRSTKGI